MTTASRCWLTVAGLALAGLLVFGVTRLSPQPDQASRASAGESATSAPEHNGQGDATAVAFSPASQSRTSTIEAADRDETRTRFACTAADLQSRPADAPENIDELQAEMQRRREPLSRSDNAEHQLAASYLSTFGDPVGVQEYARQAWALDPDHPLVLWNAAGLCKGRKEGPMCSDPAFAVQVERVLGGNGAYWAREAAFSIDNDDYTRAFRELRKAGVAPVYDTYFLDEARLVERALATGADQRYSERMIAAIGVAAARVGPEIGLTTTCTGELAAVADWQAACLALAARFSVDADTLLHASAGYSIQAKLFELTGDLASAQEAAANRQGIKDLVRDYGPDLELLMYSDEAFLASIVDAWEAHGEIAAQRFARQEIARLLQDPDYDPCALAGVVERD